MRESPMWRKLCSRGRRQSTENNKGKEVCTAIPAKHWVHKGLREGQSMAQRGGSSGKAGTVRPGKAKEDIKKKWNLSQHYIIGKHLHAPREDALTGEYPSQNPWLWTATREKKKKKTLRLMCKGQLRLGEKGTWQKSQNSSRSLWRMWPLLW